jgi:hypothetical protein
MTPSDLDVEWMKKILADLERYRHDPQIAALMDMSHPTAPKQRGESIVEHAMLPIRDLD